jgi:hypothetical protein
MKNKDDNFHTDLWANDAAGWWNGMWQRSMTRSCGIHVDSANWVVILFDKTRLRASQGSKKIVFKQTFSSHSDQTTSLLQKKTS